jgi:hypothetical protein
MKLGWWRHRFIFGQNAIAAFTELSSERLGTDGRGVRHHMSVALIYCSEWVVQSGFPVRMAVLVCGLFHRD